MFALQWKLKMDDLTNYLAIYQGKYLEISAKTLHEAKSKAFIRFTATSSDDVEIHLTDVEYDPYYLTAVTYDPYYF
jgi:hypothetical protein